MATIYTAGAGAAIPRGLWHDKLVIAHAVAHAGQAPAMSKHMLWLVAYDVREPGRLAAVLHEVKSWSTGGQRSVHECWLAPGEVAALEGALGAIIDRRVDSLLLLAPDPSRKPRTLGIAEPPRDPRFFYIG
jgi:CRISPR-associated protein Cas2